MKNVLLAVSGLSPQVITETLYALHQSGRSIDAIHVITTREGKEKIYAELLGGKDGHYYRYLGEYGIDPAGIDFGHQNIHVVADGHGNEIDDIATESDNELLLDKCLELAFIFTKNPDNAVFFSIAGGRKTMSACLTLAAQFYGRPQDRLYHVLVTPEFEGNREFYYPPRLSATIELKDKNGHSFYKETKYAQVNLVSVPFVSIRDNLSKDFLKEPKSPGTLMLSLIKEDEIRLVINLISKKIIYNKVEIDMMPAHLALYAFFAGLKKECVKNAETCGSCTDCFLEISEIFGNQGRITELYKKLCGTRPVEEMSEKGITCLDDKNFNSFKSKIKTNILNKFGPYALKDLEIASIGSRPGMKYGILTDKGKIEMVI